MVDDDVARTCRIDRARGDEAPRLRRPGDSPGGERVWRREGRSRASDRELPEDVVERRASPECAGQGFAKCVERRRIASPSGRRATRRSPSASARAPRLRRQGPRAPRRNARRAIRRTCRRRAREERELPSAMERSGADWNAMASSSAVAQGVARRASASTWAVAPASSVAGAARQIEARATARAAASSRAQPMGVDASTTPKLAPRSKWLRGSRPTKKAARPSAAAATTKANVPGARRGGRLRVRGRPAMTPTRASQARSIASSVASATAEGVAKDGRTHARCTTEHARSHAADPTGGGRSRVGRPASLPSNAGALAGACAGALAPELLSQAWASALTAEAGAVENASTPIQKAKRGAKAWKTAQSIGGARGRGMGWGAHLTASPARSYKLQRRHMNGHRPSFDSTHAVRFDLAQGAVRAAHHEERLLLVPSSVLDDLILSASRRDRR